MATRKRGQGSPADNAGQPPAKRHADEPREQQTQEGDFQTQVKIKKHYEFDWIEEVHGLVKPKQNQQDPVAPSKEDTGYTSEDSEMEDLDDLSDYAEYSDPEPNEDAIGGCYALLMKLYRANFHHDMEEPSVETSALCFELFDRYGRLKPEFKEHPIKKGSGIWKHELDSGPILLVENISINKFYRRRGWGRKMATAVLEAIPRKSQPFIALTQPGVIFSDYGELKDSLTD